MIMTRDAGGDASRPWNNGPSVVLADRTTADGTDGPTVLPETSVQCDEGIPPGAPPVAAASSAESPDPRAALVQALETVGLGFLADYGLEVFPDQYGGAHARLPVDGHFESHGVRGKRVQHWLVRTCLRHRIGLKPSEVRNVMSQLEAVAEGPPRELANRSAWGDGREEIWIDLADAAWRQVRVTPDGWRVLPNRTSRFRRFAHQHPLPEPDRRGDLRDLLEFWPALASDDDALLLLVWTVVAPIPVPRPMAGLLGPQGSAKTTLSRLLRRLLDPSKVELLGRDARSDPPLTFHKHAVPVFDNVDALTPQEADLFCQAVTGRGITRRRLYTDDDEFIFSFLRPIIFNGLKPPTNRADFLDRTLLFYLERLTPDARKALARVEAEFEAARPRLFGGLLNVLSRTLALVPQVEDTGLGRMADFHRYGRAAALALGFEPGQFDAALKAAEARQRRAAFDHPLALALLLFARQQRRWHGEPAELLRLLNATAREHQVRRDPESWPASPAGLGRQVHHLAESLAGHGVRVTRLRRGERRVLQVEYDTTTDGTGDDD